jgi:uncharacterized protein YggE
MSRRSRSSRALVLAAALGAGAPAVPAVAQTPSVPVPPPAITVVARGEVQVAPDRARVQVGLETKARTANAAAAENSRKQAAIIKAIQALGIPANQIRTVNYSVQPEQRWDPKEQRTILDGYRVSNIVSVETDKLDQAGPIIDAGLSNGANRIAGLEFLVKDRAKAEDAALADAVASARRQADVAAKAAGGVVAELLELILMESGRPEPVPMMAMAKMAGDASAPTPISEGMSTVAVSVSTRWRFARQP